MPPLDSVRAHHSSVQPFETVLLCSQPRASMGVSSYEVFGTIFSMCFLFLILFWGKETNLGSYTGQANTLQLCHTPVGLLLFPLSLEAEPTPQLALGIGGLLFAFWSLT